MLSNERINNKVKNDKGRLPVSQLAKLSQVLAIFVLTLVAAVVFCFSALAAVPACWLQPAEPHLLELEAGNSAGPQQRLLTHNDSAANGRLALYKPDSAIPLATLDEWPLSDSLGVAAPFYASPLPLDSNYDGLVDQLISVDFSGRVWLTAVSAGGFGATLLLADLTHNDWRFISTGGLVDVSLPLPLRPDGLSGRHMLLLLVARNVTTGEDALINLRIPVYSAEPSLVLFAELIDRSVLSDAEQNNGLNNEQWHSLLQAAGWWVKLSGQLTQPPKVIGGVIYSAVATSDFSAVECASQSVEHSLVALHLHSAGLVYNQRRFWLATGKGQLKLQQPTDGSAALVLYDDDDVQQPVLSDLLTISPTCPDCTEQLQLEHFPRWLKLATYRQEAGAH